MSRRPVAHPVQRLAKAQNRMAPGGLLWSESPIPRRHSPRVPMAGAEEPAVVYTNYFWPMDDTGLTEAGGGPPFEVYAGTPTYLTAPLAPGSTHSVQLNVSPATVIAAHVPIVVNAETAVTYEAWVSGFATTNDSAAVGFQDMSGAADRGEYYITKDAVDEVWHFRSWAPALTLLSLPALPDPVHVVWSVIPGLASMITVNDVPEEPVFDDFRWNPSGLASVFFNPVSVTRVDDVRLYTSPPARMRR